MFFPGSDGLNWFVQSKALGNHKPVYRRRDYPHKIFSKAKHILSNSQINLDAHFALVENEQMTKCYLVPLLMVFCASTFAANRVAPEVVDVAVVLATDVSGSIADTYDLSEYVMQKAGIAKALRDPELANVLESCNGDGLALTYVEWSGSSRKEMVKQVIGWRKLKTGADLRAFAASVEAIQERSSDQDTDVRRALSAAADILRNSPYQASRQIISISSDGEQSVPFDQNSNLQTAEQMSIDLKAERDRLLEQGFVIDALVITNDPNSGLSGLSLDEYYRRFVVGGPNHILVQIQSFEEYAEGLRTKLRRELDNCAF